MKGASKQKFLEKNPVCCFCGGIRPATSIDHQPGRVFFVGKRMPDDSIYPACEYCQDVSRDAENLMSLLITPYGLIPTEFDRWQRRHQAIMRKFPEFVADLVPSEELARDLRSQISSPPPGHDPDSMITLDAALWEPIMALFGKKLTLAMHYRGTGRPLTPLGRIVAMVTPNGHHDKGWDDEIAAITAAGPSARHGSEDLSAQITLRWAHNPDQRSFCCRVTIHQAMILYGFTAEPPFESEIDGVSEQMDGPFSWYHPILTADTSAMRSIKNRRTSSAPSL